jgi:hypothetical protein
MISDDASVREKTRVHMQDCAKAAAEVGAKIIAGPLYSPVGLMTGRAAPMTNGSARWIAISRSGRRSANTV